MFAIFIIFWHYFYLYVKAGPNTVEKATHAESSQVHVPSVHDEKAPPNLGASSQLRPMHDVSTNSYEQNASGAARKAGGNQSTASGLSNRETRPSGIFLRQ